LEREQALSPGVRSDTRERVLRAQLEAAEASVAVAEAKTRLARRDLELAELALQLTIVRAPVLAPATSAAKEAPGVGTLLPGTEGRPGRKLLVLDRKVALGQMIGPPASAHLFTLAGDLSVMHVEAQAAEGDIGRVRVGMRAPFTLSISGTTDERCDGRVVEVRMLPVSERGAIFYKVVIEADNQRDPATGAWRLRPGLTANVDIVLRERARTWKVPAAALGFRPEDDQLTETARARLARWDADGEGERWGVVWVIGDDGRPWPVRARVRGSGPRSEPGIRDASTAEVLEWDADLSPRPDPAHPATYPQVIIATPPRQDGPRTTVIKF
jgi:multidrug efflux pump subunit AcrA (membrane-fusion protein)